mgnify:CR=1 FL=1
MRYIIVIIFTFLFIGNLASAETLKGSVILTEFTGKTIATSLDWNQTQLITLASNTENTKAKSIQGVISFDLERHEHQLPYFQIVNSTPNGVALETIELIYRGDSEPQIRIFRKMTNHTGADITFEDISGCELRWEIKTRLKGE